MLLLTAAAAPASASPLGDPAIDRAVFGGTTTAHASSLAVNPAALVFGRKGIHVHLTGAGTHQTVSVDRRTIDPDTGDLQADGSSTSTAVSPGGTLGIFWIGARVAIGSQIVVPPAEQLPDGGDRLAYHSRGGSHRESWASVGVAYRWRTLSFGATARWVRHDLALRFARDTALEAGRADVAATGLEAEAAREDYRIDAASRFGVQEMLTVSFGAMARLVEGWWIGLSYQFPQGAFASLGAEGDVEVTRAPRDGGETVSGETTVRFSLPHRLRVGVRGRILDDLDLVVELRRDTTSRFSQYDVRMYGLELDDAGVPELYPRPRGLRDQYVLQAGVEQPDVGQRWRLGGRVGVDRGQSADDKLSPQQAYPWGISADAGVQLRIAPQWSVQLGYGVRWSPSSDSGRGAYDPIERLDCIDSGFDIDSEACEAVRAGYAIPTASGTYQRLDQVGRAAIEFIWP